MNASYKVFDIEKFDVIKTIVINNLQDLNALFLTWMTAEIKIKLQIDLKFNYKCINSVR